MNTETDTQAADWQALAEATRRCPECDSDDHLPMPGCRKCGGTGEAPWFPGMQVECDHIVMDGYSAEVHITMCPLCLGRGRVPAPYSFELLIEVASAAKICWYGRWDTGWEFSTTLPPFITGRDMDPVRALTKMVHDIIESDGAA
jgi:hypothetical protein